MFLIRKFFCLANLYRFYLVCLMPNEGFFSITEQVASRIRDQIVRGRWKSVMPGRESLAVEFGVSGKTVDLAMGILEKEGILVNRGPGKRRGVTPNLGGGQPQLRLSILPYEKADMSLHYMVELKHQLQEAGHTAEFAGKSLVDLRMDVSRVSRLVENTNADAWVVASGSREVLQWFSEHQKPILALGGRHTGVDIAAATPSKLVAYCTAIDRLVELGHHRIVLLLRQQQRLPTPSRLAASLLKQLESHGIQVGNFNLPQWEDHPEGFHQTLDSLFHKTPPTALFLDEPYLFHAARYHLAQRGILAPNEVSLICTDPDPNFGWCLPPISHISWKSGPVVRGIVRWASHVSRGKDDRRKIYTKAEFVEGGTIGPAKRIS